MKLTRFDPKLEYGVVADITDYIREESAIIEVTHENMSPHGEVICWLKSSGLVSWCALKSDLLAWADDGVKYLYEVEDVNC